MMLPPMLPRMFRSTTKGLLWGALARNESFDLGHLFWSQIRDVHDGKIHIHVCFTLGARQCHHSSLQGKFEDKLFWCQAFGGSEGPPSAGGRDSTVCGEQRVALKSDFPLDTNRPHATPALVPARICA